MIESVTPMMRQYLMIKQQHPDCILFYRLGDFYEMFFEDALTASQELEITLTGKDCGLTERAPMCGVPYHSVEPYIARLLERGYKVAICEQTSDPATSKGLVDRDVIRIVTPGTVIEQNLLDEKAAPYLLSMAMEQDMIGMAAADVTTGVVEILQISGDRLQQRLLDELVRYAPREIIASPAMFLYAQTLDEAFARFPPFSQYVNEGFSVQSAILRAEQQFSDGVGQASELCPVAVSALGGLLYYLDETQKNALGHINRFSVLQRSSYMLLDAATRRNLELTETIIGKQRRGSLLWLMDQTVTSMGARCLRGLIQQPLQQLDEINARLDAVGELVGNVVLCEDLKTTLQPLNDIHRLSSRIAYGSVNPRECVALSKSLDQIPRMVRILTGCKSDLLRYLCGQLDSLPELCDVLGRALVDNPPLNIRDGGVFADGFDAQLDEQRLIRRDGEQWIAQLGERERERTGIKSLKVSFNRVFGYYIEISRAQSATAPEDYQRRQTLANSERFITPELKELEDKIFGAEERILKLETALFNDLKERLNQVVPQLQKTAMAISMLDALRSLAVVAVGNRYTRPKIHEGDELSISDGRHPVVEQSLKQNQFVPNDTLLDQQDNRLLIITGPNMAGKSTYMRQVALIALLAHIGSFVPAAHARVPIVDRIFTRVGASDDLFMGQSTFMVEMSEMAQILCNATSKSLLLLDEIGRGTSTFDGLSIAWAVIEHIASLNVLGAKTLFATHYHELTELEGHLPGIKNYCISVRERGDDIIFLRKIVRGGADQSFGIQVAKLAGLPKMVIERAKKLLERLEEADITKLRIGENLLDRPVPFDPVKPPEAEQLDFLHVNVQRDILMQLQSMDVLSTTPMDAMRILLELHEKAKLL